MMYDYQGMVEEVGPVQTIGTNGFTKRDLIVDNDIDSENRYPNPVKFSFKRMNCALPFSQLKEALERIEKFLKQ